MTTAVGDGCYLTAGGPLTCTQDAMSNGMQLQLSFTRTVANDSGIPLPTCHGLGGVASNVKLDKLGANNKEVSKAWRFVGGAIAAGQAKEDAGSTNRSCCS